MEKLDSALSIYRSIGRMPLAPLFTPIEKCERIREALPELPELYIKRDDFIGPLVWGNKVRKLEYSLFEARRQGADTILTFGGIQSNHARITAQVARRAGFDCELILSGKPPKKAAANFLINQLMGIPVHFVESREDRAPKMAELSRELEKKGKRVYPIPLGASDATGSFGFVRAMEEIIQQQQALGIQFDYLLHGCSSGGTQAGLVVGQHLFQQKHLNIIGVSADDSEDQIKGYILQAVEPMLRQLGRSGKLTEADLNVDAAHIGEGYAIPTALSNLAKKAFAENEGILLEDTYTAKAAAALIDFARQGKFRPSDKVLLWHTGGLLNLFK